MPPDHQVIVVGAGPAGLATSQALSSRRIEHVVLERGPAPGHTWANLYDGLVLHTGKHLSALPGLRYPRGTPLFPSRREFLDYLQAYARRFQVPVRTNAEVTRIERSQASWSVCTADGRRSSARALVIATGIVSNPHVPDIPGLLTFSGRVLHSVEYRRPDPFVGRRVLVVGAGNSAGEISVELAKGGAAVGVAVRSGARVVPLQIAGLPVQYLAVGLSRLPRTMQRRVARGIGRLSEAVRGRSPLPPAVDTPCANVPLIGFHLVEAIRAGTVALHRGIAEVAGDTVRFVDGSAARFDDVILATGYRAALQPLRHLVTLDPCGFAARRGRVTSVDHPGLYYVGHNYDMRGGLRNIAQDARLVARLVAARAAARHAPA